MNPAPFIPPGTQAPPPVTKVEKTLAYAKHVDAAAAHAQQLSDLTGEKVDLQEVKVEDIRARIMNGMIAKVVIKLPSFTTDLDEREMGFVGDDLEALAESFVESRGRKALIPISVLNELKARRQMVRRSLYDRAHKCSYGQWLPAEDFVEFKSAFIDAAKELHDFLKKVAQQIDTYKTMIPVSFAPLCKRAWHNVRKNDLLDEPPEEFAAEYFGTLQGALPDSNEILNKFECRYELSCIYTPDSEVAALFASSAGKEGQAELAEHMLKDSSGRYLAIQQEFNAAFAAKVHQFCTQQLAELPVDPEEKVPKRRCTSWVNRLTGLDRDNLFKDKKITQVIASFQSLLGTRISLGEPVPAGVAKIEFEKLLSAVGVIR